MEQASTTSSAASSVDGRSVGGNNNNSDSSGGGYLNLGMFVGSGSGGIGGLVGNSIGSIVGSSSNSSTQQQHQKQHHLQQSQLQQPISSSNNNDGGLQLLGGGGGYSLSNGFGNMVFNSTDSSLVANSGTSFDLNDFPTLGVGGGGSGGVNTSSGGVSVVGSGSSGSTGLAAALRAQQQALVQQQQQQQQQQQRQMLQQSGSNNNGSKVVTGQVGTGGNNLYRLAMSNTTNGNFNMATEDFPALSVGPGSAGSNVGLGNNPMLNNTSILSSVGSNNTSTSSSSIQRTNTNGDGLYGGLLDTGSQLDSGTGLLSGAGLTGLGGLRSLQQQTGSSNNNNSNVSISRVQPPASGGLSISTGTGNVSGAIGTSVGVVGGPAGNSSNSNNAVSQGLTTAGSALGGDYGLLGLLSVIRMTDADRNALALGSDLSLLGLNLSTNEQIFSTFSSPWTDTVATKEPHYQLPACYFMQPPALKTGHLSKFQLETLFYIFYALPKDILQAYAAQELYSREWRYHGDLKLWFKRGSPSDGAVSLGTASTAAGTQQQSSSSAAQYIYFDINTWERRIFNGNMNQNVTNGFLPEEEVRVKL